MATVSRTTAWVNVENREYGNATFRYDTEKPYDVTIGFGYDAAGKPLEWTFARDLLADGLTKPAGYADVRCHTSGIYFYLSLTSTEGHAFLSFIAEPVRAFLVDAEDLVPYGKEALDFDAELDALLKDGAR